MIKGKSSKKKCPDASCNCTRDQKKIIHINLYVRKDAFLACIMVWAVHLGSFCCCFSLCIKSVDHVPADCANKNQNVNLIDKIRTFLRGEWEVDHQWCEEADISSTGFKRGMWKVDLEGCQEPQADGTGVNDLFDGIEAGVVCHKSSRGHLEGRSWAEFKNRLVLPSNCLNLCWVWAKLPLLNHETEKGCFSDMKFTFLLLDEQPVLQHLLDLFNTLPGGVGEHQNAIDESERHD